MLKNRWLVLVLFIGAALVAGSLGAVATASSVKTWYVTLAKPSWNPPNAVFGPVWTTLYVLMGVAAWRIWNRRNTTSAAHETLRLYFVQLLFNALWSIVFFGLRQPGWALLDLAVLWGLLVVLLIRFWKSDRIAAALWLPYVAWVTFAGALNFAVWRLN